MLSGTGVPYNLLLTNGTMGNGHMGSLPVNRMTDACN